MNAKLPILGFSLVTVLAAPAMAHEDCQDGSHAPATHRGAPSAPIYSTPVGYGAERYDGRHDERRNDERYRADVNDLRQSDGNRDGRVTLAEALRHGRRDFRRTDTDANRALSRREASRWDFAREDRDRNGWISYGEYQDAIRRSFARFDSNRDGVLARYELYPNGSRAAGWWR